MNRREFLAGVISVPVASAIAKTRLESYISADQARSYFRTIALQNYSPFPSSNYIQISPPWLVDGEGVLDVDHFDHNPTEFDDGGGAALNFYKFGDCACARYGSYWGMCYENLGFRHE